MKVSLERQIQCVHREIALRERVYPGLVDKGRMTPAQAQGEIEAMRAVLQTLQEGGKEKNHLSETVAFIYQKMSQLGYLDQQEDRFTRSASSLPHVDGQTENFFDWLKLVSVDNINEVAAALQQEADQQ